MAVYMVERPMGYGQESRSMEWWLSNNSEIAEAYRWGGEAHQGQVREGSGEPYFEGHCVEVARILCEEWGLNNPTMIAVGMLHDVLEDTTVTEEQLRDEFGDEVA